MNKLLSIDNLDVYRGNELIERLKKLPNGIRLEHELIVLITTLNAEKAEDQRTYRILSSLIRFPQKPYCFHTLVAGYLEMSEKEEEQNIVILSTVRDQINHIINSKLNPMNNAE